MAKRSRRKPERHSDMSEEEWRDWREKFQKRMEKRGMDFAEEVKDLGERFGRRMNRRERKERWMGWWSTTFGFMGSLIKSIFGMFFLVLGILALNFVNIPLGSTFISSVSSFFFRNLHWFFAAFLFFSYSDYLSRRFSKTYLLISPIVNSIGAVFVIWVAVWILNFINFYAGSSAISFVSNFLYSNLLGIFFLFLVLGYVLAIIKIFIMQVLRD